MRIGHSLLSSDRDFGYRHGNPSPKIGEIKSTSYPTVRVLNCTMSCRIIPYTMMTIFRLGSDGYL